MSRWIKISLFTLIVLAMIQIALPVHGKDKKSFFTVGASVTPVLKAEVISKTSDFKVTKEDAKRGYVTLTDAMIMRILTNNTNGFILNINFQSEVIEKIDIIVDGVKYNSSQNDGQILLPKPNWGELKNFSLVIHLSKNAKVATYSLPLSISTYLI